MIALQKMLGAQEQEILLMPRSAHAAIRRVRDCRAPRQTFPSFTSKRGDSCESTKPFLREYRMEGRKIRVDVGDNTCAHLSFCTAFSLYVLLSEQPVILFLRLRSTLHHSVPDLGRSAPRQKLIRQTYGGLGSAGNGNHAEKNGNGHSPETARLLIMSFIFQSLCRQAVAAIHGEMWLARRVVHKQ